MAGEDGKTRGSAEGPPATASGSQSRALPQTPPAQLIRPQVPNAPRHRRVSITPGELERLVEEERKNDYTPCPRPSVAGPRPLPNPPVQRASSHFFSPPSQVAIAPKEFDAELRDMSTNPATYSPSDSSAIGNRATSSPANSTATQVNGNGISPVNYMAPLPVGHQQDLNYLFSQIQELSTILKDNRERVNGLTAQAEQVAVRCFPVLSSLAFSNSWYRSELLAQLPMEKAARNLTVSLSLFLISASYAKSWLISCPRS